MEYLQGLLIPGVVSSIVSSLIVFAARTYISNRVKSEYDMKLEAYKSELKSQNEVEIERLRSALAMMSNERQVRFSAFHEKLKEVVPSTYALIQEYRTAARNYTNELGSHQDLPLADRRILFDKCNHEFWDYFLPNELYFSGELARKMRILVSLSIRACNFFCRVHEPKPGRQMSGEDNFKYSERCESLLNEEENLFIQIREEFRRLIDAPLDESGNSNATRISPAKNTE